jgi:hypothetical protein
VRRVLLIVLGLGAVAGGAALAQGQGSENAYQLQEPPVTSRQVLRLPSDASCIRFTRATVRFLPPPGAVFGVLQVRANGTEAARMTGVPRAASATVRLSGRRTELRVSGTTLGGQVVGASRVYRRCGSKPASTRPRSTPKRRTSAPKPKTKPKPRARPRSTPVPVVGGGDDG